jgi:diguanylate cyclase (GGDEF)-like protein
MVIAIDLDNLREWNKHGHLVGNQALSKVARSIEGAIRKESGDYACRLGTTSDEFIATIRIEKDLDISKLEEIFQKFKRAVNSQHLPVNGVELPVTAAMGYAVVKEGERVNADEIINAADFNQISDKNSEIKAARIKEATQRLIQVKE